MKFNAAWLPISATVLTVLLACTEAGENGKESSTVFDEHHVEEALSEFTERGFVRVTREPRKSQHVLASSVVVWVNEAAADAYVEIDPTNSADSAPPFPAGTIVIKQNLGPSGEADGSGTVMAKFDEGFNIAAGDWWWGRFDASGSLVERGVVAYCVDCHVANGLERTDFLRGTDPSNRIDDAP